MSSSPSHSVLNSNNLDLVIPYSPTYTQSKSFLPVTNCLLTVKANEHFPSFSSLTSFCPASLCWGAQSLLMQGPQLHSLGSVPTSLFATSLSHSWALPSGQPGPEAANVTSAQLTFSEDEPKPRPQAQHCQAPALLRTEIYFLSLHGLNFCSSCQTTQIHTTI